MDVLFFSCALLIIVGNTNAYRQEVVDFCSSVIGERSIQNQYRNCSCQPGKRGPAGIPGVKGEKGDIADGSVLQDKVNILGAKLKMVLRTPEIALHYCSMGMKSGAIPDSSISTSTDHNPQHAGKFSRLDNPIITGTSVGAWCPTTSTQGQWIQVDFGTPQSIAAIVTQVRADGLHWVESYKVACGNVTQYMPFIREKGAEKVFRGNTDVSSKVMDSLEKPASCRYVRIYPRSWRRFMCLRMEFIKAYCP